MGPSSCRLGYVPAFPSQPEPFVVAKLRSPSKYAIVETMGEDQRILFLVDDKGEATQLAFELRGRGVKAMACRTRSPGK